MEQYGIMPVSDIQAMYAAGGFEKSPYHLRAEALDRPLSREELVRVLIHLAQRRGYRSNSTAEAAKNEKETGKVKSAIEENRACMEQHGVPPRFRKEPHINLEAWREAGSSLAG